MIEELNEPHNSTLTEILLKHSTQVTQERIQECVQRELGYILFLSRGARYPLGPENPLKFIDFIDPRRATPPPPPPPS